MCTLHLFLMVFILNVHPNCHWEKENWLLQIFFFLDSWTNSFIPIIHLRVILDLMPTTSAKEPAFSALLPCHAHTGGPSVPSLILTYETLRVHKWTDLPHRSLIRFYLGLIIFSFILQKWVIVILLDQYRALYSWNDLKHSVTYFPLGTSINKDFGASHPCSATQRTAEMKPVNVHWDHRITWHFTVQDSVTLNALA